MTTLRREPILVVEDDPGTQEMLVEQLKRAGYDAICASSGGEALQIVAQRRPSIIISDWLMKGIDGLSLCRLVRQQQGSQFVYFVMLTVQASKAKVVEALDAGADDFLIKPVCYEELLARLRAATRTVKLCNELIDHAAHIDQLNKQLTQLNVQLAGLAHMDELTGIANRRHGQQSLKELWGRAARYEQPLACAMVDIDKFKLVNDEFGHIKGDEVLQKAASVLRGNIRDCDMLCRWGGEEFLVLFPMQVANEARACMERCCRAIRQQVVLGPTQRPVTVSVGIASRDASMRKAEDLVRRADDLLYAAKNDGRNCIRVAGMNYVSDSLLVP